LIGENLSAMKKLDRREFILTTSAATFATAAGSRLAAAPPDAEMRRKRRVFVGSSAPDGILSYDWDPTKGDLTAVGVAAKVPRVAWLAFSHEHRFVYSASELPMFNGKPTGEVASFRVENGELHPLTAENSAGVGTCHVGIDHTGQMLIAADYVGGSAASFTINEGRLSKAVWTEHYTFHGPNTDRQQTAHAHFASFSPDNRFAYINDLGGDCIHIYKPDTATAMMTPAGSYQGAPG
jgi:6-phosphogluconolactonase